MKAENTRKALKIMMLATDLPIPDFEAKKVDDELEELERISTEYESNKHYIELGKAVEYAVQNEIRFIRQMANGEKLAFIDKYDKAKLLKIYNEILEKNKNNKVPNECYLLYGEDLDKCSTQSNEGCSRCSLFKGEE